LINALLCTLATSDGGAPPPPFIEKKNYKDEKENLKYIYIYIFSLLPLLNKQSLILSAKKILKKERYVIE
jgi:hypothetical protein